jgi:TolA-binding protein
MENIIFYGLLLLCIALLFVIGYNYSKINRLEAGATFWENSFNDVSKRLQEVTKDRGERIELIKASIESKNETIEELEQSIIDKDETIDAHILTIDERQRKIIDQSNAMQKQVDEITILKEQVESLTNHLQEKAKPFDPLEELDNLTIRPKKAAKKK